MKIGILTLSISVNYGGILQAFALQTSLKKMGYNPYLINRRRNPISTFKYIYRLLKRFILRFVFKRNNYVVLTENQMRKQEAIIGLYTNQFIQKYITPKTKEFYSSRRMRKLHFDAVIVGSDQIWRPRYTSNIYDYFLDFVSSNGVKKISYAASFGTSEWEFTPVQTRKCALLLRKFNAVSVREHHAIPMCEKYFGIDAVQVLDPTMLLTKEEYISLLSLDKLEQSTGNLMVYILDMDDYKKAFINKFAEERGLIPFDLSFKDKNVEKAKSACPVEKWLRGFVDAEFIITDSFHGTVFAILFNKPFMTIGNENRGLSRFNSLLSLFNLENRMINSVEDVSITHLDEIIWDEINYILNKERTLSYSFLRNALEI